MEKYENKKILGETDKDKNNSKLLIDKDPIINYEKNNLLTGLFHAISAILLNLLPPKIGSALVDKTTDKGKEVKNKATTYYALDTMYTTYRFSPEKGILKGTAEYLWFKLGNPRAVRNRLKLVKKFVKEIIINNMKNKERVFIFSLGCGSARAIIESLYELKGFGKDLNSLDVKLLDKDQQALDLSKAIISNHGLKECNFSFILDKIRNFDKYLEGQKPDIIEMVGVLDYLPDDKAIEIFQKIFRELNSNGFFITANIRDNWEVDFVTKTINWKMIYREPADLLRILVASGFDKGKIKIIYEPLKTHGVAICQK